MPEDLKQGLDQLFYLLRDQPPDVQRLAVTVALRAAETVCANLVPGVPTAPTSGSTGTSTAVTVSTICPQGHALTVTLT
jgi:hypothetical protein